jgi:hypothetical protein
VLAESDNAASGLVKRFEHDLEAAPVLTWQWRAEAMLQPEPSASEQAKSGDDFLARVYVVREGFFPWQSRAVNYVWARRQPVGEHWPNPFADQAVMVVVQSGARGLGEWHAFRRDVQQDFRRLHGMDVDRVHAVAIMTDTDNTGSRASACYRLPTFSARQ